MKIADICCIILNWTKSSL